MAHAAPGRVVPLATRSPLEPRDRALDTLERLRLSTQDSPAGKLFFRNVKGETFPNKQKIRNACPPRRIKDPSEMKGHGIKEIKSIIKKNCVVELLREGEPFFFGGIAI